MGILDQITQMKNLGKSEPEIIQVLQSQGIPPKEIQDYLGQAQIKMAVSGNNFQMEDMQQSIMDNPPEPGSNYPPQYSAQPQTGGYPQQQANYPQEDLYQQTYSQQNYYPQENYSYQESYPPQEAAYAPEGYGDAGEDTNALIEISEQVFSDKIKKVQETIEILSEFKALTDAKVDTMEQRLKRIESTIDQLQISILDKVGSYGQNLSSIKKEMNMMQDSFGKIINPFLDKKRKL
jgi:hypothetical protein